jgi:hypothetical protein
VTYVENTFDLETMTALVVASARRSSPRRIAMLKVTLLTATLALTATAARADVHIVDNNKTITVDCAKDKSVNIAGNKATVTLKGTCDMVNISGNKATVKGSVLVANISGNSNALTLDGVDGIMVSGNENTVTYKKAVKEKSPKMADTGTGNKISQTK